MIPNIFLSAFTQSNNLNLTFRLLLNDQDPTKCNPFIQIWVLQFNQKGISINKKSLDWPLNCTTYFSNNLKKAKKYR